ncbi:uncharacterized protein LOC143233330 [Tachypleus tridentatus]|uniref:uncharacterized protein LOC143233330 n=1 Tax=Tachypleus tridentatus TaxID=6853 RepID=UPI003FD06709
MREIMYDFTLQQLSIVVLLSLVVWYLTWYLMKYKLHDGCGSVLWCDDVSRLMNILQQPRSDNCRPAQEDELFFYQNAAVHSVSSFVHPTPKVGRQSDGELAQGDREHTWLNANNKSELTVFLSEFVYVSLDVNKKIKNRKGGRKFGNKNYNEYYATLKKLPLVAQPDMLFLVSGAEHVSFKYEYGIKSEKNVQDVVRLEAKDGFVHQERDMAQDFVKLCNPVWYTNFVKYIINHLERSEKEHIKCLYNKLKKYELDALSGSHEVTDGCMLHESIEWLNGILINVKIEDIYVACTHKNMWREHILNLSYLTRKAVKWEILLKFIFCFVHSNDRDIHLSGLLLLLFSLGLFDRNGHEEKEAIFFKMGVLSIFDTKVSADAQNIIKKISYLRPSECSKQYIKSECSNKLCFIRKSNGTPGNEKNNFVVNYGKCYIISFMKNISFRNKYEVYLTSSNNMSVFLTFECNFWLKYFNDDLTVQDCIPYAFQENSKSLLKTKFRRESEEHSFSKICYSEVESTTIANSWNSDLTTNDPGSEGGFCFQGSLSYGHYLLIAPVTDSQYIPKLPVILKLHRKILGYAKVLSRLLPICQIYGLYPASREPSERPIPGIIFRDYGLNVVSACSYLSKKCPGLNMVKCYTGVADTQYFISDIDRVEYNFWTFIPGSHEIDDINGFQANIFKQWHKNQNVNSEYRGNGSPSNGERTTTYLELYDDWCHCFISICVGNHQMEEETKKCSLATEINNDLRSTKPGCCLMMNNNQEGELCLMMNNNQEGEPSLMMNNNQEGEPSGIHCPETKNKKNICCTYSGSSKFRLNMCINKEKFTAINNSNEFENVLSSSTTKNTSKTYHKSCHHSKRIGYNRFTEHPSNTADVYDQIGLIGKERNYGKDVPLEKGEIIVSLTCFNLGVIGATQRARSECDVMITIKDRNTTCCESQESKKGICEKDVYRRHSESTDRDIIINTNKMTFKKDSNSHFKFANVDNDAISKSKKDDIKEKINSECDYGRKEIRLLKRGTPYSSNLNIHLSTADIKMNIRKDSDQVEPSGFPTLESYKVNGLILTSDNMFTTNEDLVTEKTSVPCSCSADRYCSIYKNTVEFSTLTSCSNISTSSSNQSAQTNAASNHFQFSPDEGYCNLNEHVVASNSHEHTAANTKCLVTNVVNDLSNCPLIQDVNYLKENKGNILNTYLRENKSNIPNSISRENKDNFQDSHPREKKDNLLGTYSRENKDNFLGSYSRENKDNLLVCYSRENKSNIPNSISRENKDNFLDSHSREKKDNLLGSYSRENKSNIPNSISRENKDNFLDSHSREKKDNLLGSYSRENKGNILGTYSRENKDNILVRYSREKKDNLLGTYSRENKDNLLVRYSKINKGNLLVTSSDECSETETVRGYYKSAPVESYRNEENTKDLLVSSSCYNGFITSTDLCGEVETGHYPASESRRKRLQRLLHRDSERNKRLTQNTYLTKLKNEIPVRNKTKTYFHPSDSLNFTCDDDRKYTNGRNTFCASLYSALCIRADENITKGKKMENVQMPFERFECVEFSQEKEDTQRSFSLAMNDKQPSATVPVKRENIKNIRQTWLNSSYHYDWETFLKSESKDHKIINNDTVLSNTKYHLNNITNDGPKRFQYFKQIEPITETPSISSTIAEVKKNNFYIEGSYPINRAATINARKACILETRVGVGSSLNTSINKAIGSGREQISCLDEKTSLWRTQKGLLFEQRTSPNLRHVESVPFCVLLSAPIKQRIQSYLEHQTESTKRTHSSLKVSHLKQLRRSTKSVKEKVVRFEAKKMFADGCQVALARKYSHADAYVKVDKNNAHESTGQNKPFRTVLRQPKYQIFSALNKQEVSSSDESLTQFIEPSSSCCINKFSRSNFPSQAKSDFARKYTSLFKQNDDLFHSENNNPSLRISSSAPMVTLKNTYTTLSSFPNKKSSEVDNKMCINRNKEVTDISIKRKQNCFVDCSNLLNINKLYMDKSELSEVKIIGKAEEILSSVGLDSTHQTNSQKLTTSAEVGIEREEQIFGEGTSDYARQGKSISNALCVQYCNATTSRPHFDVKERIQRARKQFFSELNNTVTQLSNYLKEDPFKRLDIFCQKVRADRMKLAASTPDLIKLVELALKNSCKVNDDRYKSTENDSETSREKNLRNSTDEADWSTASKSNDSENLSNTKFNQERSKRMEYMEPTAENLPSLNLLEMDINKVNRHLYPTYSICRVRSTDILKQQTLNHKLRKTEDVSRIRSMDFLLSEENRRAILPPENMLSSLDKKSENEMRIERSLDKLSLPHWYKGVAKGSFILNREKERRSRWRGLSSSVSSSTSLVSSRFSNRNVVIPMKNRFQNWRCSNSLKSSWESLPVNSPEPFHTHGQQSSHLSTHSVPLYDTWTGFCSFKKPYLGWRATMMTTSCNSTDSSSSDDNSSALASHSDCDLTKKHNMSYEKKSSVESSSFSHPLSSDVQERQVNVSSSDLEPGHRKNEHNESTARMYSRNTSPQNNQEFKNYYNATRDTETINVLDNYFRSAYSDNSNKLLQCLKTTGNSQTHKQYNKRPLAIKNYKLGEIISSTSSDLRKFEDPSYLCDVRRDKFSYAHCIYNNDPSGLAGYENHDIRSDGGQSSLVADVEASSNITSEDDEVKAIKGQQVVWMESSFTGRCPTTSVVVLPSHQAGSDLNKHQLHKPDNYGCYLSDNEKSIQCCSPLRLK